jgi:hypothetical protein
VPTAAIIIIIVCAAAAFAAAAVVVVVSNTITAFASDTKVTEHPGGNLARAAFGGN